MHVYTVRTTRSAMEACALLESTPGLKHYMGHKGRPLGASMPNFDWQNGLLPDPMHNISNVCKMLLRCLVGFKTSYGALYTSWGRLTDSRHRAECELLGIFPRVWRGAPLPWRFNGMDHDQVCTNSHTTYTLHKVTTLVSTYPHFINTS